MVQLLALALYVSAAGFIISLMSAARPRTAVAAGVACALVSSTLMLLLSAGMILFGLAGETEQTVELFFGMNCDLQPFRAMFMLPIALIGFAGALHSIRYIGTVPKHGIAGVYYPSW